MRISKLGRAFTLAAALAPATALGWGQHYLVTDRVLAHPSCAFLASERVKVEPLEAFLAADGAALAKLFDDYYAWLGARGSKRFHPMRFDAAHPAREEFLHAARLNPATKFPLVRRLLPGEKSARAVVPTIDVLQSDPVEPAFFEVFEDVAGTEESARDVLVTYVDEPDWRIDDQLWGFTEYGYGKLPYGEKTGTASRAPFHVLFHHENLIVRLFAPELAEGMTLDRVELFERLAALALRTGHPYWGYRFLAWTLHYVEDLAQPYHSKAVPSAGWGYYLKFMFSLQKERIKRETTQLVKNRHFAYEDFVAHGLEQSYLEKTALFSQLASALSTGEVVYDGVADAEGLLERVGAFAAGHGAKIDRAIIAAYGPHRTEDPGYDLQTDPAYKAREVIAGLSPDAAREIAEETGKDFGNAARGARTMLRLTLGAGGARAP